MTHFNASICATCVGDQFLATQIEKEGAPSSCAFCGETRNAMTLEAVGDIIKPVYERSVVDAEESLEFDRDSDKVYHAPGGDSPSDIVQELLSCEPEVPDVFFGQPERPFTLRLAVMQKGPLRELQRAPGTTGPRPREVVVERRNARDQTVRAAQF